METGLEQQQQQRSTGLDLKPDPGTESCAAAAAASRGVAAVGAAAAAWPAGGAAASAGRAPLPKRTVCDHCRRRRIRCDGQFPCLQCQHATLTCKREHVPRKRGPKRGHGRVINELRAQEGQGRERGSRESSADPADCGMVDIPTDGWDISASPTAPSSVPSSPPDSSSWNRAQSAPESQGIYTSDQYRPTSRSYLYLIPQCIELYYEHLYPIMPVLYMPAIRAINPRAMTYPEKNLVYALCALTCLHMSGKSIQARGPESWEAAGRFFVDECVAVRQSYDFFEDQSLYAVVSSFWLHTSFFEISQARKSWLYLREALTLALDLGLDDDSTYVGLSPEEKLCRQRVFWILFVTERSYAILRNRPITLKKTPSLPRTRHSYEAPDIHSGFRQLISSYVPLDESFVAAWNDSSDPSVSATAYLALQDILARPPSFLTRSRATTPSSEGTARSLSDILTPHSTTVPSSFLSSTSSTPLPKPDPETSSQTPTSFPFFPSPTTTDDSEPDPTDIQKADLLITQQWLRMIVWRSSEQRHLLSFSSPHSAMDVLYPMSIASDTASILQSLPSTAVEVHGMGMFEKIFKIGTSYIDALSASDSAGVGLDMGILGVGRRGFAIDPLEFFVKTLSATGNSRTRFAEELIAHAGRRPGGMKMALSPMVRMEGGFRGAGGGLGMGNGAGWGRLQGEVLGEVTDESDLDRGAEERAAAGATSHMPVQQDMVFGSDFDVGLVSPVTDQGFADGIPGLGSGLVWQPTLVELAGWPGTPEGRAFALNNDPDLGGSAEGLAYGTFDGNGIDGFPRYQGMGMGMGPPDQGTASLGQEEGDGRNIMSILQDDVGQDRKRNWEGGLGAW